MFYQSDRSLPRECATYSSHCSFAQILIFIFRQASDLLTKVQTLEALLQDIYPRLDTQSAELVEGVIDVVSTLLALLSTSIF